MQACQGSHLACAWSPCIALQCSVCGRHWRPCWHSLHVQLWCSRISMACEGSAAALTGCYDGAAWPDVTRPDLAWPLSLCLCVCNVRVLQVVLRVMGGGRPDMLKEDELPPGTSSSTCERQGRANYWEAAVCVCVLSTIVHVCVGLLEMSGDVWCLSMPSSKGTCTYGLLARPSTGALLCADGSVGERSHAPCPMFVAVLRLAAVPLTIPMPRLPHC